jgi:predicted RNA-binding Zn ribbon-like protein
VADPLCLAFVNTLDLRLSDAVESLHTYADLAAWAEAVGAAPPEQARALRAAAAADAPAAEVALQAALFLREALYRVLAARLARQAPHPGDVATVDEHLGRVRDRLVLGTGAAVVRVATTSEGPPLEAPLGFVARDAARLLVQLEADQLAGDVRLRSCPGSPGRACGWLFVDTTRNRNRRYCVSALCGNRARAHRFAERRRAAGAATPGDRQVPTG